jgi:hypothetical protein
LLRPDLLAQLPVTRQLSPPLLRPVPRHLRRTLALPHAFEKQLDVAVQVER